MPDQPILSLGRVRRLLLTPAAEWARIAAEPMSPRRVLAGWAAPLAAIGPVASLVAGQVWGFRALDTVYRPPLASAVAGAVAGWLLALAAVAALALAIEHVAPGLDAKPDRAQAFKVAAFGATSAWAAQLFLLVPALSLLTVLGFHSLYLLWVGVPIALRPPAPRAPTLAAVTVACALVLFLVASVVGGWIGDALTPPLTSAGSAAVRSGVP